MAQAKLIIVAYLAAVLIPLVKPDDLENFVLWKVVEFPNWVKNNSIDPLSIQTGEDQFAIRNTIVQLNVSLSNPILRGFSSDIDYVEARASLLGGFFSATHETAGSILMTGNYTAKGTLMSSIPIETQGSWYLEAYDFRLNGFTVWFNITESGNLNITQYGLPDVSVNYPEVYFENLWDTEPGSDYEEFIKQSMETAIISYLSRNVVVRSLDLQFWQHILSETTLVDIIGTTRPPPPFTTTTAPTTVTKPTETPTTTTNNPCKSHDENGKIVETVSKKLQLLDVDGKPVTYVKTCTITKVQAEL